MGFENTGKVWTAKTLQEELATLTRPDWCDAVTLHHTAAPSLAQRPDGLTARHLDNIKDFYKETLGWSSGPHLFVDEDQLWGMCDFRRKGIHAVSFNKRAIGIEVLGDYDRENPESGRGLACWKNAAAATKVILDWLGLPAKASTVLFHRDDPKTSKTCPGKKIEKSWILDLIKSSTLTETMPVPAKPLLKPSLQKDQWRFIGERWCVPVRAFFLKSGMTEAQITQSLKKTPEGFYFAEELLEGAFYDKNTASTWAPIRELIPFIHRKRLC